MPTKDHLQSLISKLIDLGEDKESLEIWPDLFDTLNEEQQAALILNMEDEIKDLEYASKLSTEKPLA